MEHSLGEREKEQMNRDIPCCVANAMRRIRRIPAGETYADVVFAAYQKKR